LPVPVFLVYIDIADSERNERLRASGVATERGGDWEAHSTERDSIQGVLSAHADVLVNSFGKPEAAVDTIVEWLRNRGAF
jgi:hypothetical protein